MRYTAVVVAAAIGLVSAQQDCQGIYKSCIAAGTPEVVCQCSLYSCSGEDSARLRAYCATATAGLATVTGTIPQPSGAPQVDAPAGSIPLGGTCGADEQCSGGAKCFGTTAGTIRTCGSFNAECSSDSQCATNTCQNGICSGFLASSVSSAMPQPTFACNPAHQYPPGQVCATVSGTLALVTTTGTATTAQATYACNPAHQYPPGQVCATVSGTLALVTTTGTATTAQATYACNPAHQYPPGQVCATVSGTLALVTTTGTATMSQATYACNPAHQYPPGQVCATVSGTLALVTTTGGAPYAYPTMSSSATPYGYGPAPTGAMPSMGGNNTTPGTTPYTGGASSVGATLGGLAAVAAGVAAWAL